MSAVETGFADKLTTTMHQFIAAMEDSVTRTNSSFSQEVISYKESTLLECQEKTNGASQRCEAVSSRLEQVSADLEWKMSALRLELNESTTSPNAFQTLQSKIEVVESVVSSKLEAGLEKRWRTRVGLVEHEVEELRSLNQELARHIEHVESHAASTNNLQGRVDAIRLALDGIATHVGFQINYSDGSSSLNVSSSNSQICRSHDSAVQNCST